MINRYVGRLETGQNFVAAHTLIPGEQAVMGLVIDSMSSRHGDRVAQPNHFGWIIRPLAVDLMPFHAEIVLRASGEEVQYIGTVTVEQMSDVLTRHEMETFFETAGTDYFSPDIEL